MCSKTFKSLEIQERGKRARPFLEREFMQSETPENDVMTRLERNSKDDLQEESFQVRLESEISQNHQTQGKMSLYKCHGTPYGREGIGT